MKYHQRDIVEVNFQFADGVFKPKDISRRLGSIKEDSFNEIVDKIITSIF